MNNIEKYNDVTVENFLTFDYNSYTNVHVIQIKDYYDIKYFILLRDLLKLVESNSHVKKASVYTKEDLKNSDILKNNVYTINYIKTGCNESEVVEIVNEYTSINFVMNYVANDSIKKWYLNRVYNTIFLLSYDRSNFIIDVLRGEMSAGSFKPIHNNTEKVYTVSNWKTDIFNKLKLIVFWLELKDGVNKQLKDAIRYCILEMNSRGYDCNSYKEDYVFKNQNNPSPFALDIIEYYDELREVFTDIVDKIISDNNLIPN